MRSTKPSPTMAEQIGEAIIVPIAKLDGCGMRVMPTDCGSNSKPENENYAKPSVKLCASNSYLTRRKKNCGA